MYDILSSDNRIKDLGLIVSSNSKKNLMVKFPNTRRFQYLSVASTFLNAFPETALKNEKGKIVYIDDLGYSDIRLWNSHEEIIQEIMRLAN